MTRPAKLAAFAAMGFFVVYLVLTFAIPDPPSWIRIVKHALEGAVIGVLCDFIAVRKVFEEARKGFEPLSAELGNIVAQDLIKVRSLVSNPREKFEEAWPALKDIAVDKMVDADLRSWILGLGARPGPKPGVVLTRTAAMCLRSVSEDKRTIESIRGTLLSQSDSLTLADLGMPSEPKLLESSVSAWWQEHGRSIAIDWLAELDVRIELGDLGSQGDPWLSAQSRRLAAKCIRKANKDTARIDRLRKALVDSFGWASPFVGVFVGSSKIQSFLQQLADSIEQGAKATPALLKASIEYGEGYLDAWHSQPLAARKQGATDLVDGVTPKLIEKLCEILATHVSTVRLAPIVEAIGSTERLQKVLGHGERWLLRLSEDTEASTSRTTEAVVEFGLTWLDTWHALPRSIRLEAAGELMTLIEPILHTIVNRFAGSVEPDALEKKTSELVRDRIRDAGEAQLTTMLREQAGPRLDWIKVNGLVLGAIFGAGFGAITAALDWFSH